MRLELGPFELESQASTTELNVFTQPYCKAGRVLEQSEGSPKIVLKSLTTKVFSHMRHLIKALGGRGSPDRGVP